MKKHIMFGGFDYAVRWEMDQDAVYTGIDYFVDNDPQLIGTTYLGKAIYGPEKLLEEDRDNILILIGSIIYHTEIEFQLQDMGFEEDIHYKWAIGFCGDETCPRLWKHTEWKDRQGNAANLQMTESGEYPLERLRITSRLIDFEKTDVIVDFCAANERVRAFLPEDVQYIPVDYIPYSKDTIVCDLNRQEFPNLSEKCPNVDSSRICALLVGAIPCIQNWKWLLKKVTETSNTIICTHNDFVRINREYRRTHFTNYNAVFNHQIILEMQKLGFVMTAACDSHLKDVIMKFERR